MLTCDARDGYGVDADPFYNHEPESPGRWWHHHHWPNGTLWVHCHPGKRHRHFDRGDKATWSDHGH